MLWYSLARSKNIILPLYDISLIENLTVHFSDLLMGIGYCHFTMPKTNCIFILWRPIKFDTPWVTAIALERDDTKRNYINGEIKCEWLGVELL